MFCNGDSKTAVVCIGIAVINIYIHQASTCASVLHYVSAVKCGMFACMGVARSYSKTSTVIVKPSCRCRQQRLPLWTQQPSRTWSLCVISFRTRGVASTMSLSDALRERASWTSGFAKQNLSLTPGTGC